MIDQKKLIENRIDSLIDEIKKINSLDEYLRIKYYSQMIFKIELIKSYLSILKDIELREVLK